MSTLDPTQKGKIQTERDNAYAALKKVNSLEDVVIDAGAVPNRDRLLAGLANASEAYRNLAIQLQRVLDADP